jgi:uncharacterized cupin superfamily protein
MVVVRLAPLGPGLHGLTPDPATPLDALLGPLIPDERSHTTLSLPLPPLRHSVNLGTWGASPHTCRSAPYPFHEFCYVLEGEVVLTVKSGANEDAEDEVMRFGKGEAFFIERGTVVEWAQSSTVRKFYVIIDQEGNGGEEGDDEDSVDTANPDRPPQTPVKAKL